MVATITDHQYLKNNCWHSYSQAWLSLSLPRDPRQKPQGPQAQAQAPRPPGPQASYPHAGKGAVRLLRRGWRLDMLAVTQSPAYCGLRRGAGGRRWTHQMGSWAWWTRWCHRQCSSSTCRAARERWRSCILSLAFAAPIGFVNIVTPDLPISRFGILHSPVID